MRIKVALSSALLQRLPGLGPQWHKFWYEVGPAVTPQSSVESVVRQLFAFLRQPECPVRLACDGFFIAPRSPAAILRDGDCISVCPGAPPLHTATVASHAAIRTARSPRLSLP